MAVMTSDVISRARRPSKWILQALFLGFVCLFSVSSWAQVQHKPVKRLAVFPLAVGEINEKQREELWWKVREELTKPQLFLVAARRHMVNRGVFQPRKSLKPAEVIVLGQALDSHAVVTIYSEDRNLTMKIYEAENGYLLWEKNARFDLLRPAAEQAPLLLVNFVQQFITQVPYHGYSLLDPLEGQVVIDQQSEKIVQAFIGPRPKLQPGDEVEWITLSPNLKAPLYQGGGEVRVIATGIIQKITDDKATILLQRLRQDQTLNEDSLLRITKLTTAPGASDVVLPVEFRSEDLKPLSVKEVQQSTTTTALAVLANIAIFILFAF